MRYTFLWLVPLFAMLACQGDSGNYGSANLPQSNGGRLDVMVVAEEGLWQDVAGETFRKYFTKLQAGLPQAEPVFNVRQVTPKQFNSLLHRSRNLVFLNLGEKGYSIEKNRFAAPQVVAHFSAESEEDLARLIRENQLELSSLLHEREVAYLEKRITAKTQPLPDMLKENGVSMRLPADFEVETSQENLLVLWKKGLKSDQGIIIHFEPIQEDDAVLGDRIIPLRDSLTRLHVPGEHEGSYMLVEDYIPPTFTNTTFDGNFAIETRGLWRTEGDFMGGSFINYTIFDEEHHRRITLDAFIYAPDLKKRDIILELEGILKTFEIN